MTQNEELNAVEPTTNKFNGQLVNTTNELTEEFELNYEWLCPGRPVQTVIIIQGL